MFAEGKEEGGEEEKKTKGRPESREKETRQEGGQVTAPLVFWCVLTHPKYP